MDLRGQKWLRMLYKMLRTQHKNLCSSSARLMRMSNCFWWTAKEKPLRKDEKIRNAAPLALTQQTDYDFSTFCRDYFSYALCPLKAKKFCVVWSGPGILQILQSCRYFVPGKWRYFSASFHGSKKLLCLHTVWPLQAENCCCLRCLWTCTFRPSRLLSQSISAIFASRLNRRGILFVSVETQTSLWYWVVFGRNAILSASERCLLTGHWNYFESVPCMGISCTEHKFISWVNVKYLTDN
jgi:hypothetical protein